MIYAPPAEYSLNDLKNINQIVQQTGQTGSLTVRQEAIQEAATVLGAQAGLRSISDRINKFLESRVAVLDKIYDFNQLLLPHHILPPVISANYNTSTLAENSLSLSINGEAYHIVKPAKFVVTPPTWRDYLFMSYAKPRLPDPGLLPKNNEEQQIWDKAIESAWQDGVKQGMSMFQTNMHYLTRDFQGMLLFKKMIIKGMITMPQVSIKQYGITGDNSNLVIDNKLWKLNQNAQFNLNATQWQPVLADEVANGTGK